jgi:predicted 3-demethylubiquinone-9 3-methyltransferase (glyoxalase superfamily)
VTAVREAPGDYAGGKEGDVLTVEFTVLGIPCLGLNGGPEFRHSEAFSFQIATDNQEETDRYWNAIIRNGGKESQCGWCKDRWGLSWQITPRVLTDALAAGGDFGTADIAFVLGANDVVNPLAEQKGSPIYGMPILDAHKARTVVVNKRSMASGYAGIDNPLFYMDKTMMVFGDAKKVVEDIVKAIE